MIPIEGEPWLKCPTCGYDLRGLTRNRCPECGDFFDRDKLRNQFQKNAMANLPTIAAETTSIAIVLPVAMFFFNCLVWLIAVFCFPLMPYPGVIPEKAVLLGLFSECVIGPTIVFSFYRYRLRKYGIPLFNWATIILVLVLTGGAYVQLTFVYKVFN